MPERDTKPGSKPGSQYMTLISPVTPQDLSTIAAVMEPLGKALNEVKLRRHREIEAAVDPEQVIRILADLKAADRIYSELIWMIKHG